jgi:hypothetical protein
VERDRAEFIKHTGSDANSADSTTRQLHFKILQNYDTSFKELEEMRNNLVSVGADYRERICRTTGKVPDVREVDKAFELLKPWGNYATITTVIWPYS